MHIAITKYSMTHVPHMLWPLILLKITWACYICLNKTIQTLQLPSTQVAMQELTNILPRDDHPSVLSSGKGAVSACFLLWELGL